MATLPLTCLHCTSIQKWSLSSHFQKGAKVLSICLFLGMGINGCRNVNLPAQRWSPKMFSSTSVNLFKDSFQAWVKFRITVGLDFFLFLNKNWTFNTFFGFTLISPKLPKNYFGECFSFLWLYICHSRQTERSVWTQVSQQKPRCSYFRSGPDTLTAADMKWSVWRDEFFCLFLFD